MSRDLGPIKAVVTPRPGRVRRFFRRVRCILFGHRSVMSWLSVAGGPIRCHCGYCGRWWVDREGMT